MSLASWLGGVRASAQQQDGHRLRTLLSFDSDAALAVMQLAQRGVGIPASDVHRQLPSPWAEIITAYLQALLHFSKGERLAACKEYREHFAKALLDVLTDEAWVVPAMIGMAVNLKHLSEQADEEQAKKGVTSNQLGACAMLLASAFSKTAAAKIAAAEKRTASVAVACIMFKVYFKLNTINNCKNVAKSVDVTLKVYDVFDSAAAAHRVTFRYYTGRLAAYDEDFDTADKHLSYAYAMCHRDATQNQRKILRYLIPIKMLLGVLPSDSLLQQYQLQEYRDIKEAVRSGDVALLMRVLEANKAAYVQAGTYLLLEKLQLATYRRLFKKCALIHAELNPAKATQVPMALFQTALQIQGIEKDNADIQCILANLIYRKYIKGYLAYKNQVVVLAKTEPFPDLATVQLGDPFAL
mmetsp:Transcript_21406/g.46870  ORF Transcript_21406/g.46870 Transcript_21406/m.46870 type:complete len:411 (-) Transcript_21406:585-1817(-)